MRGDFLEAVSALKHHLQFLKEMGVVTLPSRPGTNASATLPATPPATLPSALPVALPAWEQTQSALETIREKIGDCQRCKLHNHRTHIVFGTGNPRADLVFIGEAPGQDEDLKGEPFVGKAGQLLTRMIRAMALSRDQVYIANIVKCRPPGNRNPEPEEIASCEPFLAEQLLAIRPAVICALGSFAAQTLLQTRVKISQLRGKFHLYRGIKVMPTFHPAYLLRNPQDKNRVWEDLQMVMAELKRLRQGEGDRT